MKGRAASEDLQVIQKTYDLVLWFVPRLARLPRSHRFGLGEVLTRNLYQLLQGLAQARFAREKAQALAELNGLLDGVRYQVRLLRDLDLMDLRRYEFASQGLRAIGLELGAWRRSLNRKSSPG